MKKTIKTAFAACLVCLAAAACSDLEEHPAPSNADIDWFARRDNPDDAIDHRLFEIYERSGIGIFYSDTLGSQTRGTYADGTPYVFHYVVDLAYSIDGSGGEWGSQMTIDIRNTANRKGITTALDLLETHVLPNLPRGLRPKCIILCDSMVYQPFEMTEQGDVRDLQSLRRAFRGMNALGLAQLCRLDDMTALERTQWAARALAACYATDIAEWDAIRMRDYYALSAKPDDLTATYYAESVWGDFDDDWKPFIAAWESYGFLYYSEEYGLRYYSGYDLEDYELDPAVLEKRRSGYNNFHDTPGNTEYLSSYTLPTRHEDVEAFLAAALTSRLTGSDDWFEARYDRASCPVLYAKYEMMKEIAADYMAARINR